MQKLQVASPNPHCPSKNCKNDPPLFPVVTPEPAEYSHPQRGMYTGYSQHGVWGSLSGYQTEQGACTCPWGILASMAILSLCFEFSLYPWRPWDPCDLQEHGPVLRRVVSALYLLCVGQTPSVYVYVISEAVPAASPAPKVKDVVFALVSSETPQKCRVCQRPELCSFPFPHPTPPHPSPRVHST